MATPTYDLMRKNYILFNPLKITRFQRISLNFIEDVRSNAFQGVNNIRLIDIFCDFISSKPV